MYKKIDISQLIPDDKNLNKGTDHGQHLIEKSLRKFGAGRSILIDKNNRIVAGNKTVENAGIVGIRDVIIVETDGSQIIAVKRRDVDLDSEYGRELALADNASAKENIEWDNDVVLELHDSLNIDFEEWSVPIDDILDPKKRPGWGKGGDEARCDMLDRLKIHKKGDFYFISIWQKSEEGRPLSDIKGDPDMIPYFADKISEFVPAMIGQHLSGGYCIITAPKRRHKETNFATEVCKLISEKVEIPFYEDVILCKNKRRVNAIFTQAYDIPEKNVIIFDDITTTGSTLTSIHNVLKDKKNCFFLVGINNNN